MTIIVFDTETTGLTEPNAAPIEKQPKMWEFAGIKLDENLQEIDRMEFLVDPEREIPQVVKKICNIDDSAVKGKGSFSTHLIRLQEFFLGTREMVAHNLAFDRDILYYELSRCGMVTRFPWPQIHTCTIELTFHLNNYRLNLTKLHDFCFGEGFKDSHRAMADVEALTRCFVYLRQNNILFDDIPF